MKPCWRATWLTAVRDALIVVVGCAVVALAVNTLRPRGGLALVQRQPYQILVPCPEILGEVEEIAADDPRLERALLIDARDTAEFEAWHAPGAINVPYDYLAATPEETVQQVAASGVPLVVVYGDGDDPDSGHELAREFSGKGIRNVFFIVGGAAALKPTAAGGER